MSFSPRSPEGRIYICCPFEEKDEAKELGAKWDARAGSWYVPGNLRLEPFHRWHPEEREYIVCSYSEKDDAKDAGARWDASCKQWYFDVDNSEVEANSERWLPSTVNAKAKSKPAKKATPTKYAKTTKTLPQISRSNNDEMTSLAQLRIDLRAYDRRAESRRANTRKAMIPRISKDMTIPQLQAECRARDPSIKGLGNKKKRWFLEHLEVGTPWISAEPPMQEEAMDSDTPWHV